MDKDEGRRFKSRPRNQRYLHPLGICQGVLVVRPYAQPSEDFEISSSKLSKLKACPVQNDVITATPVPGNWSIRVSRSAPSSRVSSDPINDLGATTPDRIILKIAG